MGILTEHRPLRLARQNCHNILIYNIRGAVGLSFFIEKKNIKTLNPSNSVKGNRLRP